MRAKLEIYDEKGNNTFDVNDCIYKKLGTFSIISGEDGQITDPNIVGKNIIIRAVGGNLVCDGAFFGTTNEEFFVDKSAGTITWRGINQEGLTYRGDAVAVAKFCILYEYGWF